jgi:hypothetical protein
MMIPVYFYPANYYCHHVFLLPLLATAAGPPRRWSDPEGRTWLGLVATIVLLMGVLQYFTLDQWAGESDATATGQSVIMLGAYALILYPLARAGWLKLAPTEERQGDGGAPPPGWSGPLADLWRWWAGAGPLAAHEPAPGRRLTGSRK